MRSVTIYRALEDGVEVGRLVAEKKDLAINLAMELYGSSVSLEVEAVLRLAAGSEQLPENAQKAIDSLGELDYCKALDSSPEDDTILAAAKRRARAVLGKE